jgi:multidrug resistance efflux pump
MKKLIIAMFATVITTGSLLAAPIKANMQSMIEGQIVYEVPLNSHVKKGQLIEKVDTREYRATILKDQAALNYYKDVYKADKSLAKTHSISKVEYLKSKYDILNALEQKKLDQVVESHCYIYAPFNGKITKITTYPGSGIGDGSLIMEITKDRA